MGRVVVPLIAAAWIIFVMIRAFWLVGYRPTERATDTASPWARRGGWLGEVASPAVVVGRLRRAADAIVRCIFARARSGENGKMWYACYRWAFL